MSVFWILVFLRILCPFFLASFFLPSQPYHQLYTENSQIIVSSLVPIGNLHLAILPTLSSKTQLIILKLHVQTEVLLPNWLFFLHFWTGIMTFTLVGNPTQKQGTHISLFLFSKPHTSPSSRHSPYEFSNLSFFPHSLCQCLEHLLKISFLDYSNSRRIFLYCLPASFQYTSSAEALETF